MVELGAEWLITPIAYRDQWPGIEFLSQGGLGNLLFPAETSLNSFDPAPGPMNKAILIQHIVEKLTVDISLYLKAANAARAAATHEQSKAENKYDTRGLEASYLARGQARQVGELEASIQQIRTMTQRPFTPDNPIDLGAYVETERRGIVSAYLLAPRAGGTEVTVEGQEVMVITPQSPLGRQLIGHRQGDSVKIELAGRSETHRIHRVS
jgi:transcription elongation GreA/GreB family factor